ncbi:MAG: lysozyme [Muribaculaceae bacterium]
MRKIMMLFVALLTLAAATPAAQAKRSIMELPLFERAVLIIKKFETLHKPKHWPYVGYGHCVQPGDPYRRGCQLSEKEADALLRKDLCKFVSLYKHMGERNAILLGTLAYNIGPGAVNKSSVYKKLKRGDTNIYKEYTSHSHYKGKFHKGLYSRRLTEIEVLFR